MTRTLPFGPLLLVVAACSTGPSSSPSRAQATRAPRSHDWLTLGRVAGAAPSGITRVPVRVGASTRVAAHVLPNASCVLRSEVSDPEDPSTGLSLVSGETGLLHFNAGSALEAATTTVRLDCTDKAGTHAAYAIELRGDPKAERESEKPDLTGSTVRPALAENERLRLTDEELSARGYPPRPDRATSPEAYERWANGVSRPITFLATKPIPLPNRHNGSSSPFVDNDGWSGAVVNSPVSGSPLIAVGGQFRVPNVVADPNGGNPAGDEGQRSPTTTPSTSTTRTRPTRSPSTSSRATRSGPPSGPARYPTSATTRTARSAASTS